MRSIIPAAAVILLAACAVVEPPSGGPEDKLPPEVIGVHPSPDSSGVARDSGFILTFSEKIYGDSFKKLITVYPPVEFDKFDAKGNRLEITFRGELPETTFCVLLRPGFKDNHDVAGTRSYTYYFSTAESIDDGSISGKILFKQKPDTSGVIKLLAAGTDTIADIRKAVESRTAYTNAFGDYSFKALPSDSTRFIVWAFIDRDKDGRYSDGKDFYAVYPDTLLLTGDSRTLSGITLNIIDPDEPAVVEGRVIDETGYSGRITVRFERTDEDAKPLVTMADTTGNFAFSRMHAGYYAWSAFIDLRPDSLQGDYTAPEDSTKTLREPGWQSPDTIYVSPGETKVLKPVTIKPEIQP